MFDSISLNGLTRYWRHLNGITTKQRVNSGTERVKKTLLLYGQ